MDTQSSGPARKAAAGGGQAPVSRGYAEELEHWAWCIRHPAPENQPRCHPRVAMADAIIALTANLAAEQGKPIRFQEEWFDPDKDDTPEGLPLTSTVIAETRDSARPTLTGTVQRRTVDVSACR